MCWRWWTFSKSRRGKKTNAQDESLALRGVGTVLAVHLGGARNHHQAQRSRARALRRVLFRLLHGGDLRAELADVPRPRLRGRAAVTSPATRSPAPQTTSAVRLRGKPRKCSSTRLRSARTPIESRRVQDRSGAAT